MPAVTTNGLSDFHRRKMFRRANITSPSHWIGGLLDYILPGKQIHVSVAIGVVVYLAGLAIAAVGGFASLYATPARSWQFYVLGFLIAWVLAWGAWATAATRRMPDVLRPAIAEGQRPAYDESARTWLSRLYSGWLNLLVPLVILVPVAWYLISRPPGWHLWLDDDWSDPAHRPWKLAVLFLYFTIVAFLSGAMVIGFWYYSRLFVAQIYRFPLVRSVALARAHLRPITSFGLLTGFGWSVATTAVAVFFIERLSIGVIVLLSCIGVMAVWLVLAPQFAVHLALVRLQDELVIERGKAALENPGSHEATMAEAAIKEINAAPTWIYSPSAALALGVEILVPAVTTAAGFLAGQN
jgi:hypothetical protein